MGLFDDIFRRSQDATAEAAPYTGLAPTGGFSRATARAGTGSGRSLFDSIGIGSQVDQAESGAMPGINASGIGSQAQPAPEIPGDVPSLFDRIGNPDVEPDIPDPSSESHDSIMSELMRQYDEQAAAGNIPVGSIVTPPPEEAVSEQVDQELGSTSGISGAPPAMDAVPASLGDQGLAAGVPTTAPITKDRTDRDALSWLPETGRSEVAEAVKELPSVLKGHIGSVLATRTAARLGSDVEALKHEIEYGKPVRHHRRGQPMPLVKPDQMEQLVNLQAQKELADAEVELTSGDAINTYLPEQAKALWASLVDTIPAMSRGLAQTGVALVEINHWLGKVLYLDPDREMTAFERATIETLREGGEHDWLTLSKTARDESYEALRKAAREDGGKVGEFVATMDMAAFDVIKTLWVLKNLKISYGGHSASKLLGLDARSGKLSEAALRAVRGLEIGAFMGIFGETDPNSPASVLRQKGAMFVASTLYMGTPAISGWVRSPVGAKAVDMALNTLVTALHTTEGFEVGGMYKQRIQTAKEHAIAEGEDPAFAAFMEGFMLFGQDFIFSLMTKPLGGPAAAYKIPAEVRKAFNDVNAEITPQQMKRGPEQRGSDARPLAYHVRRYETIRDAGEPETARREYDAALERDGIAPVDPERAAPLMLAGRGLLEVHDGVVKSYTDLVNDKDYQDRRREAGQPPATKSEMQREGEFQAGQGLKQRISDLGLDPMTVSELRKMVGPVTRPAAPAAAADPAQAPPPPKKSGISLLPAKPEPRPAMKPYTEPDGSQSVRLVSAGEEGGVPAEMIDQYRVASAKGDTARMELLEKQFAASEVRRAQQAEAARRPGGGISKVTPDLPAETAPTLDKAVTRDPPAAEAAPPPTAKPEAKPAKAIDPTPDAVPAERPVPAVAPGTGQPAVSAKPAAPPAPLPKRVAHYTLPENVEKILAEGYDTTKPPVHGTGGKEGGLRTGKAGGDVLYFTTDKDAWSTADIYVGPGKGDITKDAFDYKKQEWVKEKDAYKKVDLSKVEAEIRSDAKIIKIDSFSAAQKFGVTVGRYTFIQDLVDKAKAEGYDILNVVDPGGKAWHHPSGDTTKYGDKDWYPLVTGNSGKDDYFILNRAVIEFAAPAAPPAVVPGRLEGEGTLPAGAKLTTNFGSGLTSSPSEAAKLIAQDKPVGVAVLQVLPNNAGVKGRNISKRMQRMLAEYANRGGQVFIDSGAVTAFRKTIKTGVAINLDWDTVLGRYEEMVGLVSPENRGNVFLIAPDVVGNHDATLELLNSMQPIWQRFLDSGVQVIFPVQRSKGATILGNFADMTNFYDRMDQFVMGIPFNNKSWSHKAVMEAIRGVNRFNRGFVADKAKAQADPKLKEIDDWLTAHSGEVELTNIRLHLLGAGADKVQAVLDQAAAEGLDYDFVSGDAMTSASSRRKKGKTDPDAPDLKPKLRVGRLVRLADDPDVYKIDAVLPIDDIDVEPYYSIRNKRTGLMDLGAYVESDLEPVKRGTAAAKLKVDTGPPADEVTQEVTQEGVPDGRIDQPTRETLYSANGPRGRALWAKIRGSIRRGSDKESADSHTAAVFDAAHADSEAGREYATRVGQHGYEVVYVKDMEGIEGYVHSYFKLVVMNTTTKDLEAAQDHEYEHILEDVEDPGALARVAAVDENSEAFKELHAKLLVRSRGNQKIAHTKSDVAADLKVGGALRATRHGVRLIDALRPGGLTAFLPDPPPAGEMEMKYSRAESLVGKTRTELARNDDRRIGTSKLGTETKPQPTPQDSNITGAIAPYSVLANQMKTIVGSRKLPGYRGLPQKVISARSPVARRAHFVDWMRDNIIALFDVVEPAIRNRSMRWYFGSNRIAHYSADRFNFTVEQSAAIYAALSPQKDWFLNVAQGEQVMGIYRHHWEEPIAGDVIEAEYSIIVDAAQAPQARLKGKPLKQKKRLNAIAREKRRRDMKVMLGKSLAELDEMAKGGDEDAEVARDWGVRVLAQAVYGRHASIVSPEGDSVGPYMKDDGTPQLNGWGSTKEIRNTLMIIQDGSLESISEALGRMHKVRSFYNNILSPASHSGDLTSDTHAVAAGFVLPLAGKSLPVSHNFGSKIPNTPATGLNGSYHMFADAYRAAAAARGVLPLQMQSVVWEAIRGMYPSATRRDPKYLRDREDVWVHNSEQDARAQLTGQSIRNPDWARPDDGGKSAARAGVPPETARGEPESGRDLLYRGGSGSRLTDVGVPGFEVSPSRDLKYSREEITPDQDREYLAAVKQRKMKRAQDLADQAAKAAGFGVGPVIHATPSSNTSNVLDPGGRDPSLSGPAIWFQTEDGATRIRHQDTSAGVRNIRSFVRMENPLEFLRGEEMDIKEAYGLDYAPPFSLTEADAGRLRNAGFDGVVMYNKDGTVDEGYILDSSQIKSADPVTRDDQGNVIPLSKRFDPTTPDIRYSREEITPDQAREHLAAEARGDTAEGQRMVDEAAKKTGLQGPFWRADTPLEAQETGTVPKDMTSAELTYPNVIDTSSAAIYLSRNPELARYFATSVGEENEPRQFYIDAKRTASSEDVSRVVEGHYLNQVEPRTIAELKQGEEAEMPYAGYSWGAAQRDPDKMMKWNTALRAKHINVAEWLKIPGMAGNSLMVLDEAVEKGVKDFWITHAKDDLDHELGPALPWVGSLTSMPQTEQEAWDLAISNDRASRAYRLQEKEEGWSRGRNVSHLTSSEVSLLKKAGYDSVEGEDVQGTVPVGDLHEIAVFDRNQIKSADPFTYDDAGNLIPLSQRFDPTTTDIRYSREDSLAAAHRTEKEADRKWPGVSVSLHGLHQDSGGRPVWDLSLIVVPKGERKQGTGSAVMRYITEQADKYGATITLSPATDFGATSVGRLRKFYGRFGFKRNRGRQADHSLSGAMYRRPGDNEDIRYSRDEDIEPAPMFYSGLQRSVKDTRIPNVMPPDQMLNKVLGLPGVKKQEVIESGLQDWLATVAGEKVSKDNVVEFLEKRGVKLEVVRRQSHRPAYYDVESLPDEVQAALRDIDAAGYTLSEPASPREIDAVLKPLGYEADFDMDGEIQLIYGPDPSRAVFEAMSPERLEEVWLEDFRLISQADDAPGPHGDTYQDKRNHEDRWTIDTLPNTRRYTMITVLAQRQTSAPAKPRYAEYAPPGGIPGSYKEMLITVPVTGLPRTGVTTVLFPSETDVDGFLGDMAAAGFENMDYGRVDENPLTVDFVDRITPEVESLVEVSNGAFVRGEEMTVEGPSILDVFVSSHWTEPNVIAAMMTDMRTVPLAQLEKTMPELAARLDREGRTSARVFHMIEGQSDLHQKGAAKGYKLGATRVPTTAIIKGDPRKLPGSYWEVLDQNGMYLTTIAPADQYTAAQALQAAADPAVAWSGETGSSPVPDLPFKGDAWKRLMMRGVLSEAAAMNADLVTWSSGADRFVKWGSPRIDWAKIQPLKPGETAPPAVGWDRESPTASYLRMPDGTIYATVEVENGTWRTETANRGQPLDYYPTRDQAEEATVTGMWKLHQRQLAGSRSTPGWLVDASEQTQGEHAGMDIEELARSRGLLLEEKGVPVETKDDLYNLLSRISRDDDTLDKLTSRVWERMQSEDEGTSLPRKEFFQFMYDQSFRSAASKVLKQMDKTARVGTVPFESYQRQPLDRLEVGGSTWMDPVEMHAIPITPAIREAAGKGQPMYSREDKPLAATRKINMQDLPESLERVQTATSLGNLKRIDGYTAAKKSADPEAAVRVVMALAPKIDLAGARAAGVDMVVAADTKEAGSRNALPYALSAHVATELGIQQAVVAVIEKDASNTGLTADERYRNRMTYEVDDSVAGQRILVVDDNYTSGETLVAILEAIEAKGGRPVFAVALAHSQAGNGFRASQEDIDKLLDGVGLDAAQFRDEIGFAPGQLTGAQIQRLTGLNRAKDLPGNIRHRLGAIAPVPEPGERGLQASREPRAVDQTETPAFKQWFADSQVYNNAGPRVLYHGTTSDIDAFTLKYGLAGHFGSRSAAHDRLSDQAQFSKELVTPAGTTDIVEMRAEYEAGAGVQEGANIMPVFLRIEKPVFMQDVHFDDVSTFAGDLVNSKTLTIEEIQREIDPGAIYRDAGNLRLQGGGQLELLPRVGFEKVGNKKGIPGIVDLLKAKGYDGIIYENRIEDPGNLTYIPFTRAQIKSATGNRGTWDRSRVDINYSREPQEDTPAFKRWFASSKVVNDQGAPTRVYGGHANVQVVGSKFKKGQATAGAFFFTEDPDMASSYAMGKMGVNEWYERGSQYRITHPGSGNYTRRLHDVDLDDAQYAIFKSWWDERYPAWETYLAENAPYDEMARWASYRPRSLQSWFQVMESMGDNIAYADEGPGPMFVRQTRSSFEDLMVEAGIQYQSAQDAQPGIIPVYLRIQNPLDASAPLPAELMADLEAAVKRKRMPPADEVSRMHWTRDYPLKAWVADIKAGDAYWATQVPRGAIEILKRHGFDGIKDTGGKGGGPAHPVWIAFDPNQIKSAIGNRGTFSLDDDDIRYSREDRLALTPEQRDIIEGMLRRATIPNLSKLYRGSAPEPGKRSEGSAVYTTADKLEAARSGPLVDVPLTALPNNPAEFSDYGEFMDFLQRAADVVGQADAKPLETRPDAPTEAQSPLHGTRDERFNALAEAQRGEPEELMLRVSDDSGGGVLQVVVEHAGDLTHRMAQRPVHFEGGFEWVVEKVDRVHHRLHYSYGFEREMREQLSSNAKFFNQDPTDQQRKLDASLSAYAEAHGKLTVWNDAQRLGRDLAVAVGEQRWDDARRLVSELKDHTDQGPEHWKEFALRDEGAMPDAQAETVSIPIGKRQGPGRARQDVPKILYHRIRGDEADAGGLKSYPLRKKESDLVDLFPAVTAKEGFVWLSPTPLTGDSVAVDASKVDPNNLRYTGQAEGYLLHRGDIPAEAVSTPTAQPEALAAVVRDPADLLRAAGYDGAMFGSGDGASFVRYSRDPQPKYSREEYAVQREQRKRDNEQVRKFYVDGIEPRAAQLHQAFSLPMPKPGEAALAFTADIRRAFHANVVASRMLRDWNMHLYSASPARYMAAYRLWLDAMADMAASLEPSKARDASTGKLASVTHPMLVAFPDGASGDPIDALRRAYDIFMGLSESDFTAAFPGDTYNPSDSVLRDYQNFVELLIDEKLVSNIPAARSLRDDISSKRWGHDWDRHMQLEAQFIKGLLSEGTVQDVEGVSVVMPDPEPADLELDMEYFPALERGKMNKVQRLVDDGLVRAGWTVGPLFHGTGAKIKVPLLPYGTFWGSTDTDVARVYADHSEERGGGPDSQIQRVFMRLTNPFDITALDPFEYYTMTEASEILGLDLSGAAKFGDWDPDRPDEFSVSIWEMFEETDGMIEYLQSLGYDGLVSRDRAGDGEALNYAVFRPEDVKSADPVTYDDQGNVIPLSQRFDPTTPDLRYSREPGAPDEEGSTDLPSGGRARPAVPGDQAAVDALFKRLAKVAEDPDPAVPTASPKEMVAQARQDLRESEDRKIESLADLYLSGEFAKARAELKRAIRNDRLSIQERQNMLRRYAVETLPLDQRGKILTALESIARLSTEEARERQLQGALRMVDKVADAAEKSGLRKQVRQVLQDEYIRLRRAKSKKGKSTMSLTGNRALQEYLDKLTITSDKRQDQINKTLAWFLDHPEEDMASATIRIGGGRTLSVEQAVNEVFHGNVTTMTGDQLRNVLSDIESIKKTGRLKRELEAAERERQMAAKAKAIVTEIDAATQRRDGADPNTPDDVRVFEAAYKTTHGRSMPEHMKLKGDHYAMVHARPELLGIWAGGMKKGHFYKNVFKRLLDAEREHLEGGEKTMKAFADIHKDIDLARAQWVPLVEVELSDGSTWPLTLDNMMWVYAHSQNPGNLAHLKGTGLTDESIAMVLEHLPPNAAEAVEKMLDYNDEVMYQRTNEAYVKDKHVDLPKEPRYFSAGQVRTTRAENQIALDALRQASTKMLGPEKGHTRARTQSRAAFRQMSYFDTAVRSLLASERYIAYSEPIRDVAALLNNPDVRRALEDRHPLLYDRLESWVSAVGYGRIRRSESPADRFSEWLRTNFVTAALGFNVVTMMKQPASFAQGARFLDKKILKEVAGRVTFGREYDEIRQFVVGASTQMRNRANNFERELVEMAEQRGVSQFLGDTVGRSDPDDIPGVQGKSVKAFRRRYDDKRRAMQRGSMRGIQWADEKTTTIVWYTKYLEVLNANADAAKAIEEADYLIRRTQPMGGLLHLPELYRGGGLARAYSVFTNQLNQNANLIWESFTRNVRGEGAKDPGRGARTREASLDILFNFIIAGLLIYMADHGGKLPFKDPKGFAHTLMTQFTGGLLYVNRLFEAVYMAATGDSSGKDFLLDLTPSTFSNVSDLLMSIAMRKPGGVLEALAGTQGLPTTQARRTFRGVTKILLGETKDPRYVIFSRYALEGKRGARRRDLVDGFIKKLPDNASTAQVDAAARRAYTAATEKNMVPDHDKDDVFIPRTKRRSAFRTYFWQRYKSKVDDDEYKRSRAGRKRTSMSSAGEAF